MGGPEARGSSQNIKCKSLNKGLAAVHGRLQCHRDAWGAVHAVLSVSGPADPQYEKKKKKKT